MDILTSLTAYQSVGIVFLRLAVGIIFIYHGFKKLDLWKMQPSAQMPAGLLTNLRVLSIVEPLGGVAMILGFLTQLVALGFILIMLGAIHYKINVWKAPFMAQDKTGWEFDFLILAASLALVFSGGGAWTLTTVLSR